MSDKLTWHEFVESVQQWAKERGIYEHSTADAQALKAISEIGELADAVIKNDDDGLKDAIGDVVVCLVNYSTMAGVELTEDPDVYSEDDMPIRGNKANLTACAARHAAELVSPLTEQSEFPRELLVYTSIQSVNAVSFLAGFSFMECCTKAWNSIKDRKGKMVAGGAFVKDEE